MPQPFVFAPAACLFAVALGFPSVVVAQTLLATRTGTVPDGRLGHVVRGIGDHDGDGVGDFVVSEPGQSSNLGRVYLISGATRATLVTFQGQATLPNQRALGEVDVDPVGDVNGDGRGDFAIGMLGDVLDVFSGASGARLYRIGTVPQPFPRACSVGDYDGDGRDDFVVPMYLNSTLQLWVMRGVSGTQLATLAATASDGRLRDVGDQNGDGRREIAVISAGTADVYSVQPPGLLRRITLPSFSSNTSIALADWNGDGRLDLAVAYPQPQFLFVYSLATGALLRSVQLGLDLAGENAGGLATLGDFDLDGVPEVAVQVQTDAIHTARYAHIAILSGRTGNRLGDWPGSAQFPASTRLAGIGDVDGDGFHDFVMGMPGHDANRGGWQVISGRPVAAVLAKPSNCYTGPFAPTLGMTRPVLGRLVTVAGRDAPLAAPGTLVLSLLPGLPTNLGVGGCDAWFDMRTGGVLAGLTVAPDWQLVFPLPNARQLVGSEIALQAFYAGTNSPIGLDLTNGLWARLGH